VLFATSTDLGEGGEERPVLFSQQHLNDLIRDMSLSKQKEELLASRLQERNLVETDVKVKTKLRLVCSL